MGNPWTADYLKITGELDVDLRSNIAAEARAKIVYERLINFTDDAGTKDALQFLMTREITHMKAFTARARKPGQAAPSNRPIAPTPGLVDQFFQRLHRVGRRRRNRRTTALERRRRLGFMELPALQSGDAGAAPSIVAESSPSEPLVRS